MRPHAWLVLLAAVLLGSLVPGRAQAQEACWPTAGALTLDFGTVSAAGGTTSGQVPIACQSTTRQTYFTVCMYLSAGDQGEIAPRAMTNYQGVWLWYDLFGDPGHSLLIGAVGTVPAHQVRVVAPPDYRQGTAVMAVYGRVQPGQAVPAHALYHEHGIQGYLRYRFSTTGFPDTPDCLSGGSGGGQGQFGTQGMFARFQDSCSLSAGDLDFGQANSLAQAVQASSRIRVTCPVGTDWQLGLGNGSHYAPDGRRMAGAGGHVRYGLYLDPAHTAPWGDTGAGDRFHGATGVDGLPVDVTVHGLVPAQPDARAGDYVDTVIATLYY